MRKFVLDSSMALAWFLDVGVSKEAEAVQDLLETHQAVVPGFWSIDVSNALLACERKGLMDPITASACVLLLSSLRVEVIHHSPQDVFERVFPLASRERITVYSAATLDLAMQMGLGIATLDPNLIAAARRMNVTIV